MKAGFEWFVAWRHLRDPTGRVPRALIVGLVLLVLGIVGIFVAQYLHSQSIASGPFPSYRKLRYLGYAKTGAGVLVGLGAVVTYVGVLFSQFTVFTSFSIFGVFLGTSAPIIALSVMSGFEADLKGKIRASKADVVIESRDEEPFSDWQKVVALARALPGVMAVTPYLEAEVMLNRGRNTSGAILRGIEPDGAASVLNLDAKMKEGKLKYLITPPPDGVLKTSATQAAAQTAGTGEGKGDDWAEPALPGDSGPPETPGDETSDDPAEETPEAAAATPGIILGEELFQRILHLWTGDSLDVTCPLCGIGPMGPTPKLRTFRVMGHFYTGMYEFDSKFVYVSLQEAQRFFGMPGEVTGIDLRTDTPERASEVSAILTRRLGKSYLVRSWEELNRALFRALKLEKIAMFIALAFIALVASFSIVSNLFMLVTEKAREVAILKSMGASNQGILRLFLFEGLYIGLIGTLTGLLVGVSTCLAMGKYGLPLPEDIYYIHQLPVTMRAWEIVAIALVALSLSCLAALYPALLASRLHPVKGLRYE